MLEIEYYIEHYLCQTLPLFQLLVQALLSPFQPVTGMELDDI